ncbi:MAG: hypothetical protein ABIG61_14020 [Planctomycetota bacterium]
MLEELKRFLVFMRPAFSRRAAYCWFVVVFTGFILRSDNFGVSSIVRALSLAPESYTCLLHFFHSTAWNVEATMVTGAYLVIDAYFAVGPVFLTAAEVFVFLQVVLDIVFYRVFEGGSIFVVACAVGSKSSST